MLTTRLRFIEPQLASLVDQPPEGKHWIYEIKHDGYRSQVLVERGEARVFTRNGYDWSDRQKLSMAADGTAKRSRTPSHVRFGSLADIGEGYQGCPLFPQKRTCIIVGHQCPLCATSGPSLGKAQAAAMSPASPIAGDRGSSARGLQGLGRNIPAARLADVIAGLIFIIFPTSSRASAERPRRT